MYKNTVIFGMLLYSQFVLGDWEPYAGLQKADQKEKAIRIACEMHGVKEDPDIENYFLRVFQSSPSILVLEPKGFLITGMSLGQAFIQRQGVSISTLSNSAQWMPPQGIKFKAFLEGAEYDYMVSFSLSDMDGLFYQSLKADENYNKPVSYLDNCEITPVDVHLYVYVE